MDMTFNTERDILLLLPKTIRDVVSRQLSPEILLNKISDLSNEDRRLLEEIKKERKLKTDEETIVFLRSALLKGAIPPDRLLLSTPLMKKLDNLNNITYRKSIRQFKENCETTSKDLYGLVLDALHSLWVEKYEKQEVYRRFEIYQEFEKILFKDPRYRDHFIHQFQVFLLGITIIDKHYDAIKKSYSRIFKNISGKNIDFGWLLAATFHDIGYLIQQFDKWLNAFFKEFLNIQDLPIALDLGKLFLIRNFQEYIDKLTSLYRTLYQNDSIKDWIYDGPHQFDNNFRKLLTTKLVEDRNHGIISSLILLDRIENSRYAGDIEEYKNTTFSSVVIPAGLSIALHDKAIFQSENLNVIDFQKDPLSFILIYSDTIQEWGRPITHVMGDGPEYYPSLSHFQITSSRVSATLTYKKIQRHPERENKTTFELKDEEIQKVLGRLKSKNPIFEIALQSLDPNYPFPERTYKSLR
jgi:hypothetical protein